MMQSMKSQLFWQQLATWGNWIINRAVWCKSCRRDLFNPLDQRSIYDSGQCCLCEHVEDDV